MRGRARDAEQYHVTGVAERIAPYDIASLDGVGEPEAPDKELVERAATLLLVMPCQHRETIEELLSPNDPQRGRRAVDALIESAFATEDESGHLRRVG